KDLLQQIFRVGLVSQHPDSEAIQPSRVCAIQLLEGSELATAASIDELELVVVSPGGGDGPLRCHLRRRHGRVALPGDTRLLTENKALSIEIPDPPAADWKALRSQQGLLELLAAPVPPKAASGGNNPVARHAVGPAAFHDV